MQKPRTALPIITTVALLLSSAAAAQSGSFVIAGRGCPDRATEIDARDESVLGPFGLGFNFPFTSAGGMQDSTATIEVSSNGSVYLLPGTIPTTRCCTANLTTFATDTARIAVFDEDLDPSAGGRITFEARPDGSAVVRWIDVPAFGAPAGGASNCLQLELFDDGRFVVSHQRAARAASSLLVGYSPGSGATDPGPSDLGSGGISGTRATDMIYEVFGRAQPYDLDGLTLNFAPNAAGSYNVSTGIAPPSNSDLGLPVSLSVDGPPQIGRRLGITVHDLPNSTTTAAMQFAASRVDLPLDAIGAPGCSLLVSNVFFVSAVSLSRPAVGSSCGLTVGHASIPIANDPSGVGLTVEVQAAALAIGINPLNFVLSDRGTITVGDVPRATVTAIGSDSFNANTNSGFFTVTNAPSSGAGIASLRFDWAASSDPTQSATMVFDTDQTGMADRPDGGNSTAPGCRGTYRGSDLTTGLDYAASPPSPCDPTARTGFRGLLAEAGNPGNFRSVQIDFTDFGPGEFFSWDCDTDGGLGSSGDAMAGMVVTIVFTDGSVQTGELVATGAGRSALSL